VTLIHAPPSERELTLLGTGETHPLPFIARR